MTTRCPMCSRFMSDYGPDDVCEKCTETLIAEGTEAEIGIGTGSNISGRFGTDEYCRHDVKRATNIPKGKLRLLT